MFVLILRTLSIKCSLEEDHLEHYDDDDCDKDYNDHVPHHEYHHDKYGDYDYKYPNLKNKFHYGKGLNHLLKEPLNYFHPKPLPYHHHQKSHKKLIPNLHLGHDGYKKDIFVDADKYIPKVIV